MACVRTMQGASFWIGSVDVHVYLLPCFFFLNRGERAPACVVAKLNALSFSAKVYSSSVIFSSLSPGKIYI